MIYYEEPGAKLIQGDCLELLKTVPDKSVNHFLCDLPYNILKHLKWDSEIIDLNKLYEEFLQETGIEDTAEQWGMFVNCYQVIESMKVMEESKRHTLQ
jgi:DNA modification methylase